MRNIWNRHRNSRNGNDTSNSNTNSTSESTVNAPTSPKSSSKSKTAPAVTATVSATGKVIFTSNGVQQPQKQKPTLPQQPQQHQPQQQQQQQQRNHQQPPQPQQHIPPYSSRKASMPPMASSAMPSSAPPQMATSRIPVELQKVFLASQAGQDVERIAAPKKGIGFKIFRRGLFGGNNTSTMFGGKRRKFAKMRAPSLSSLMSERSAQTAGSKSNQVINEAAVAAAEDAARQQRIPENAVSVVIKPPKLDSPQTFFDKELQARGYSTKKYCSLEGGYYCRPTQLQQASYGSALSQAVRSSDASSLRKMFDAGLSPNPCNNFGESLVHMVCRRGDAKLLRVLMSSGCSMQVTDDYGRTPLHDACWRAQTNFDAITMILEADRNLIHLLDCRGAAPLSYVGKERYGVWIHFLRSVLDRFWPHTDSPEQPPPLTMKKPHSVPIEDPDHALPLDVAALIANGRMKPEDALYLDDSSSDDSSYDSYDSQDDDGSLSDESRSIDDDDASESSYDSENSEDSDFDETEMAEFCLRAGGPMAVAKKCFGGVSRGMPLKTA